jgi:hypothetical protein
MKNCGPAWERFSTLADHADDEQPSGDGGSGQQPLDDRVWVDDNGAIFAATLGLICTWFL